MRRGASAFIIHKNKLLLLHRDDIPTIRNPNKWGPIGGIMEDGETFDECIKREVKEETNLEPTNLKYLGRFPFPDRDRDMGVYVIRLDDDAVKNIQLGDEGQELRFFFFEDLLKLPLVEELVWYFNEYHAGVKRLLEGEDVPPKELGLS